MNFFSSNLWWVGTVNLYLVHEHTCPSYSHHANSLYLLSAHSIILLCAAMHTACTQHVCTIFTIRTHICYSLRDKGSSKVYIYPLVSSPCSWHTKIMQYAKFKHAPWTLQERIMHTPRTHHAPYTYKILPGGRASKSDALLRLAPYAHNTQEKCTIQAHSVWSVRTPRCNLLKKMLYLEFAYSSVFKELSWIGYTRPNLFFFMFLLWYLKQSIKWPEYRIPLVNLIWLYCQILLHQISNFTINFACIACFWVHRANQVSEQLLNQCLSCPF